MPGVVIEWPTVEEEDRSRRFQVNKNYLLSLSQHLQAQYGVGVTGASEGLVQSLAAERGYSRIQRTLAADIDACRTALSLSWTGLVQLELASWSKVRSSLPYTNAWAPIHAYYAVYAAARAWLVAQGQITTSHAATLKAIGSEVCNRRLYPSPWNVFCVGCCDDGTHVFHNVPKGHRVADPGTLLQNPSEATFWPRYMKMIETTRAQVLKQRYDEWKHAHSRKRMYTAEKHLLANGTPATTFFDFLWRLRVRSNYRGVEAFVMTDVPESWHQDFHDSVRLVTHLSSLMFDCWLARRIARDEYGSAIDDFMKYRGQSPEPVKFLADRRRLLGAKPMTT